MALPVAGTAAGLSPMRAGGTFHRPYRDQTNSQPSWQRDGRPIDGASMADLHHILRTVVEPGLDLLPSRMDTNPARVMLLAIGLQESRLIHRRQIGGPARGLWQFEQGGGVFGVLRHRSSAALARDVCEARGVDPVPAKVYQALAVDDLLATAFARLLLFTDPRPLPRPEAGPEPAWDYYIRNWRPGKPHRHTWDRFHAEAVAAVRHRPDFSNVISRVTSTEDPA